MQTLPERDGDPQPPPDNGQHIALGCFTEYLRFLDRIGEGGSVLRKRLALPVLDEQARRADISPTLSALLRYGHLPVRDRLRLPLILRRLRSAQARPRRNVRRRAPSAGRSDALDHTFLGRLHPPRAQSARGRGRSPRRASSPCARRCSARRANSDLVLPLKPLGWMHGDAAGRVLGDRVRLDERVEVARTTSMPMRSSSLSRRPNRRACSGSRTLGSRARPSSRCICSSTARS